MLVRKKTVFCVKPYLYGFRRPFLVRCLILESHNHTQGVVSLIPSFIFLLAGLSVGQACMPDPLPLRLQEASYSAAASCAGVDAPFGSTSTVPQWYVTFRTRLQENTKDRQ